jgi:hypothetical protein
VAAPYAWLDDVPVSNICLISGAPASEVAASLRLAATGRPASLGDVEDDESLLEDHGPWTSLLQVYGHDTRELMRLLSSHDRVACLYKSVNEDMEFTYAERGDVLRRFDPLLWPAGQWGTPLAAEQGLAFGWSEDLYAYSEAVRLLERISGLTLDDNWIFGQKSGYTGAPMSLY